MKKVKYFVAGELVTKEEFETYNENLRNSYGYKETI